MPKTIAITEALKTLKNIENCLKLICQDDRSFFGEWQDPPKGASHFRQNSQAARQPLR